MANIVEHYVRGPSVAVVHGDQFSDLTANVDLSASDFTEATESADHLGRVRCCRAFVPAADGLLAYRSINDTANRKIYVLKGLQYAISLRFVDQSECAAALQIADALTLLY